MIFDYENTFITVLTTCNLNDFELNVIIKIINKEDVYNKAMRSENLFEYSIKIRVESIISRT